MDIGHEGMLEYKPIYLAPAFINELSWLLKVENLVDKSLTWIKKNGAKCRFYLLFSLYYLYGKIDWMKNQRLVKT